MGIEYKSENAPKRQKSTATRKDELKAPTLETRETRSPPVDASSRTFKTRAANGTFDRKEYMRNYMRAYNAHKKSAQKPID